MEKYPRGRRGRFAKPLVREIGAGVRIPASPPTLVRELILDNCKVKEDMVGGCPNLEVFLFLSMRYLNKYLLEEVFSRY